MPKATNRKSNKREANPEQQGLSVTKIVFIVLFAALSYHVIANLQAEEISLEVAKELYETPNSRYVNFTVVNTNFNVHYIVEGNPNGKTLLFLHGSIPSLHTWDHVVSLLESKYKIIRMDLVDMGLSSAVGGPYNYSVYGLALFFTEFMKATNLNKEKVTLVGHSYGGSVASIYAGLNPDNIENLILIASGAPYCRERDFPPKVFVLMRSWGFFFDRFTPDWMIYLTLKNFVADTLTYEKYQFYKKIFFVEGVRRANRYIAEHSVGGRSKLHFIAKEILTKITAPTLILWGTDDAIVPIRFASLLNRDIARSTVKLLNNGSHLIHEEQHKQVAEEIDRFVQKQ